VQREEVLFGGAKLRRQWLQPAAPERSGASLDGVDARRRACVGHGWVALKGYWGGRPNGRKEAATWSADSHLP